MSLPQNAIEEWVATHGKLPGPHKVVVIETPELASSLRRLLEVMGQHVEIAHYGRSGIELVNSIDPDIVFTRIEHPDMDGFCVAEEIRNKHPKEPLLVAYTGYGKWQIGERAKQAGFDLILTKPPTLVELFNALACVSGTIDCEEIRL
jgi:CheY-like chemotaxis protein